MRLGVSFDLPAEGVRRARRVDSRQLERGGIDQGLMPVHPVEKHRHLAGHGIKPTPIRRLRPLPTFDAPPPAHHPLALPRSRRGALHRRDELLFAADVAQVQARQ